MMIPWFGQELPSSCVSACVRMVLAGFQVYLTETEIRKLLGHTKLGLSLWTATQQMELAGAILELHDDWNLDDLRDTYRRGLVVIVGIERHLLGFPPASHAVVMVTFNRTDIEILDPLDGPGTRHYSASAFEQAWVEAGKEALVIHTPPTWR